jgi:hypothetical protein
LASAADMHVAPLPNATQQVLNRYADTHVYSHDGRVIAIYGAPMNQAADSNTATSDWIRQNGGVFDVPNLDLRLDWANELLNSKFDVYAYRQYVDGLPVEFGIARVLVLNAPGAKQVVYASAKLAKPPEGGFKPDRIDADSALGRVQQMATFKDLVLWSRPELVVYYGEGDFEHWITPVRAWKFIGDSGVGPEQKKMAFFVDASTGSLVHARSEIYHFTDVTGTVQGWTTPAPLGNSAADSATNPPTVRGIPQIRVRINGNNATSAYTDDNGNFTIPWAGTTDVTVDCSVGDGRWARVQDQAALALQTASATVTPGTPVTLTLNQPTQSEFTNAQMNAFTYQTVTHNHWKTYAPLSTILDTLVTGGTPGQLPANTQVAGTCNAFYNGVSTNYYNAGGGCNNTAFSNVISHEYGHHICNRLGLAQGAFGEGFGDTVAMMTYDDPIVGRFFRTNGTAVRTPDTANRQYPCSGTEVHFCGEILGNVMWEIRKSYGTLLGNVAGREFTRQQHSAWAQLTDGGLGVNSAHPLTSIEWLTIDDNDGNLTNQTPNYTRLCAAFAQSAIVCPTLDFTFPNGLPAYFAPGVPTNLRVNITPVTQQVAAGTASVFWSVNGAAWQNAAMSVVGTNQYQATIPAVFCGQTVRYYFRAAQTAGGATLSPSNAPTGFYSASVGTQVPLFSDDFEIDRGWTTEALVDPGATGAQTGQWVRVNPVGTAAQPEDDHSVVGTNCYVTGQGAAGGTDGAADVDNGTVTLISPAFSVAGPATDDVRISYWRWLNNSASTSNPGLDPLVVDLSSDNGATWTNIETIGPGTQNAGGWLASDIRLSSFPSIARTSTMKVRFVTADFGASPSLVEAAVDDFLVYRIQCINPCVADFDNGSGSGTPDGGVGIEDLLFYLIIYGNGDVRADVDDGSGTNTCDGGVGIEDLLYFLARYDAGC